MTYPPFPVNGILLSGFPAPSSSRAATYPPSLTDDVARLGVSAVVPAGRLDVLPSTDPSSEEAVAAALLKAAAFVEERVRLAVHLLRTYPWDLGFFQFQETDWVQHAFWPELASGMRTGSFPSGLTAFYRAVDNGLGALLDLLDASDHVFVISDHGFQECRKEVLLNAWLVRHGYLRIRRGPAQWVFGLVSRIRRVVDPGRRLVGRIPRERRARLASRVNLGRLDWSRSVAYVFSDGSSPTGGLYLLGAPDQAAGVLESLRALRDPETGGPVVESVLPLAEDRVDGGPRLWVGLADGYAVGSGFYSGQVFRARVRGRDTQLGIHHRHGILVVAGPGVSRGRVLEVRPRLQDVAPTVLYSLDLLVPTYMSGSVIGAIFEDGFRHAHPVRTRQEPGGRHDTTGEGLSEAEEAAIAARLKDLGYLE
jgi:predicted AlkP superfamily phosphohydrolase/phosphomutase